jgi:hypothetical protein
MIKYVGLSAALVLVLGAGAAWAHEGHTHTIMGTVMARDATHVDVKTPGGEILSIALDGKTVVVREKRRASISDVRVGRRVVVDIGNGEDPLIAGEIQVGVAEAATK